MINGVYIERGFPDDKYSTYVRCIFEDYPEYEELLGEHPLTDSGLKVYELYNLLERVEKQIPNVLSITKKMQLEEYRNQIIELIDYLKDNSKPVKDDDECFEGTLKIPYMEYKTFYRVNDFKSKKVQREALRSVSKTLSKIKK